ncbi:MAG: DUF4435 domain-containing protein [Bacteroidales bacterium]|jgi:hypothetical protein|nr:DUF4435 domain-containing protein [Bacteroidales bacterium]
MEQDLDLKNNISATDKIDEIRLALNSETGNQIIWVLVEGEDDCKIYPKFLDEIKASVEFVSGGKGQLMIALNALAKETKQVIGIQDADFLHIDKNYPAVTNLFYTDYHDIEMTMLSFDEVRCNFFTEYRMLKKRYDNIWQNVLQESSYIAYIRWYNEKNNCKIRFSELGYGDNLTEMSDGKISLKNKDLLQTLNARSQNKTEELTGENIDKFITINKTDDLLNLCNGHDITALLSLIIGGRVSHKEFCRHLRLSFTFQHFSQTRLYSEIAGWQIKYGYSILKNAAGEVVNGQYRYFVSSPSVLS